MTQQRHRNDGMPPAFFRRGVMVAVIAYYMSIGVWAMVISNFDLVVSTLTALGACVSLLFGIYAGAAVAEDRGGPPRDPPSP